MFKTSIFKGQKDDVILRAKYQGSDSLPFKVSALSAFRMIKLYWCSKDSKNSWLLLFFIVSLTSGAVWLATRFNSWYKDFWDTIQNYDISGFWYQLMWFCGLATIHVLVSVYNSYLRARLCINWRRWFTSKVLSDYLSEDSYYKIQLEDRKTENPDQRISEDLGSFVNLTVSLIIGTASDLAMLGTFCMVLWGLSQEVTFPLLGYQIHLPDGYLLYLAIVYAAIGTFFTFVIGKPLVRLNFRQQRYEADFRFSLIRLRENSESISLYKGEHTEEQILNESFVNVVSNYVKLILREKTLGFFTLAYAQTAVIFPILIAAPMYFAKIITMGSIMQINSAFSRVQDALSTVINSFSSWASYKAVIDRLSLFFDSMDKASNITCLKPEKNGNVFEVSSLNVKNPNAQFLWKNLSLRLEHGSSILVRGPSGCGKSTLIKAIAGIWPYADGSVVFPADDKTLFLSQRPYLPLGSLREAMCYPGELVNDGRCEHYLKILGLSHLIDLLDVKDNFSQMLSLGEQQRVAIIRALLIKPEILFMDEASSALDEHIEYVAYTLLKDELKNSIIFSVGHRSSLIGKHDYVLSHYDGDKGFSLVKAEQYKPESLS